MGAGGVDLRAGLASRMDLAGRVGLEVTRAGTVCHCSWACVKRMRAAVKSASVKSSAMKSADASTASMEAAATVETSTSRMKATASAVEAATTATMSSASAAMSSTATRGVGWTAEGYRNERGREDRKQCPVNPASFRHVLFLKDGIAKSDLTFKQWQSSIGRGRAVARCNNAFG
jgi:hypothetical protein